MVRCTVYVLVLTIQADVVQTHLFQNSISLCICRWDVSFKLLFLKIIIRHSIALRKLNEKMKNSFLVIHENT